MTHSYLNGIQKTSDNHSVYINSDSTNSLIMEKSGKQFSLSKWGDWEERLLIYVWDERHIFWEKMGIENGVLGTFLQGSHDQLKCVTDLVLSHIH